MREHYEHDGVIVIACYYHYTILTNCMEDSRDIVVIKGIMVTF
jgi:hypothetical protein